MPERNLDFDKIINRRGTGSVKYDVSQKPFLTEDALSFWVADMDFATSSYVEDALTARVQHGIFGYTHAEHGYCSAVTNWFLSRYGWAPETSWMVRTPGVVFSIAAAVRAFTNKGDGVLVQMPVYYPFFKIPEQNGRRVFSSDLVRGEGGRYEINFADFEKKISENNIKLFILCSPHNPVGRVWTKQELMAIGDICHSHGVVVFSDEIHADIVFDGTFYPFMSLGEKYAQNCVMATSPGKTFNLASLMLSNTFIGNEKMRAAFTKEVSACGFSDLNPLSLIACKTAYSDGRVWYAALMDYLAGNIKYAKEFIKSNLTGVSVSPHQATYLLWLDFNGTGLSGAELENLFLKQDVWIEEGTLFGRGGEGFMRLNTACPRSLLKEGLKRVKNALSEVL